MLVIFQAEIPFDLSYMMMRWKSVDFITSIEMTPWDLGGYDGRIYIYLYLYLLHFTKYMIQLVNPENSGQLNE